MAPFDLCISVCISEPWATYSKQQIGHKFCVVCSGNLFVGDGVYPPGGGGGHLATVPPWGGGEPSSLGGMDMGGERYMVLDQLSMRARGCGPSEGLLHTPTAHKKTKYCAAQVLPRTPRYSAHW